MGKCINSNTLFSDSKEERIVYLKNIICSPMRRRFKHFELSDVNLT